jgi:hypothetical protein
MTGGEVRPAVVGAVETGEEVESGEVTNGGEGAAAEDNLILCRGTSPLFTISKVIGV